MTPTREQVKQWALDAGCVSAEFWPDDFSGLMATFERFATLAMSAGRDQGLREAAAKVRAILADCEARDVDDPELEQVAQDIEQLRAK